MDLEVGNPTSVRAPLEQPSDGIIAQLAVNSSSEGRTNDVGEHPVPCDTSIGINSGEIDHIPRCRSVADKVGDVVVGTGAGSTVRI